MMIIAAVLRRTGVFGWLAIRTVPPGARRAARDPAAPVGGHRPAERLPRQRHDGRPARPGHALHRDDAARLADPVPPRRGAGLEHRGDGDPDRRPAEHPHRLGRRARPSCDFLVNLTPVVVLIFVVFTVAMAAALPRPDGGRRPRSARRSSRSTSREFITDHRLLRLSLLVLGADDRRVPVRARSSTSSRRRSPCSAPSSCCSLARLEPDELLREVDWSTLFFFVGLFMLVEGLVATGVIAAPRHRAHRGHRGRPDGHDARAAVGERDRVGDRRQHPVHGDDDPGRPAARRPPASRSSRSGGRSRWAPASAATRRSSGRPPTSSPRTRRRGPGTRSSFGQFLRVGGLVALVSLVISSVYVWVRYLL